MLPYSFRSSVTGFFAALLGSLLCGTAEARTDSLFELGDRHFENFEELQSINADIILDIQQGPNGFIWLATQKGLVRYDGYNFKRYVYREDDPSSISGDYIQAIHFAGERMWIGTYSDGVSVYDALNDTFTRIQHKPDDATSLMDNDVRAIVSRENWVVIATRAGINLFNLSNGRLSRLGTVSGCGEVLTEGTLSSLAIFGDSLFVGGSLGLCRIPMEEDSFTQAAIAGAEVEELSGRRVYNLDLLRGSELWVSTRDNGIAVLNIPSSSVHWIPVDEKDAAALNSAWSDHATMVGDEVWVATVGAGIAVIDAESREVQEHIVFEPAMPNGLNLNDVSAIFVDDAGIVWIGTWGGGMNRYNPGNRAFRVLRPNPYEASAIIDSHIQSAKEMRNGDLWLGGAVNGVQVLRPGKGLIETYAPEPGRPGALQNGYIHSIEQLPDGEIWVATNQTGAYRYNSDSGDFTQFTTEDGLADNLVRTLYAQDEHTLWLGTDAGLTGFDRRTESLRTLTLKGHPDEPFDKVIETILSYDDDLWVGTSSGLFVLPRNASTLIPVASDPDAPISDNFIADLAIDTQGRLWLATGLGLNILKDWNGSTASFISVNEKLGLPMQTLGEAMEVDRFGRVWSQDHLIDPESWSYARIDQQAGWDVGNTWIGSNTKLRDGTIIFGGTRGVMMVQPDAYLPSSQESNILITQAQVDSMRLPMAQLSPLVLQPTFKNFFVEFATTNYADAATIQYQYMLEGYDDTWIATTPRNRRAAYSRLSPGEYLLRIRASDGRGNWRNAEASIAVTQLPAWFETYWFRALALVLSMLLLYLLYRARVAQLEHQKQALDKLVERRTENIRQLAEAGQDITSSLDLDEVLTSVYTHVGEFMDTSVFAIGLLDRESNEVRAIFHYQDGERAAGFTRALTDFRSPAVWCVTNKAVVCVGNERELAQVSDRFRLLDRRDRVQSLVFYPLVVKDTVVGFLSIQSYEESAYGENEIQMLKTIASYAAAAVDNAESHSQLNSAKAEIERISLTDQLTGLNNRRFLEGLMPGEINRLQRLVTEGSNERLGIVMVDADHFKSVNDTYGHDAGDKVLEQLAGILKATCREMDWAIRLGGEEFLVIARVTSQDQLLRLAERIRSSIESHHFLISEELVLRKTCSMGVCHFPFVARAFSAVSWEQSINLADLALYRAKETGRNKWIAIFENTILEPESFYQTASKDFEAVIDEGCVIAYSSTEYRERDSLMQPAEAG